MIETVNRLWSEDIERITGAAMLMCDVDHIRQLNDGLGYAEADRLVKFAGIIQSCSRDEHDQVARYGGEEFLVPVRVPLHKRLRPSLRNSQRVEAASPPTHLPSRPACYSQYWKSRLLP